MGPKNRPVIPSDSPNRPASTEPSLSPPVVTHKVPGSANGQQVFNLIPDRPIASDEGEVVSKPASPIRVFVLEDKPSMRDALVALLGGSPGFTCVGACGTAEAALQQLPLAKPDVVLVDLELPGMSGTEFLAHCRCRFPAVERLVLTLYDTAAWIFPALAAGASGYVVKGTPAAKLLEAIAEVHEGRSWMSGQVARLVLGSFQQAAPPAVREELLSPREREVLGLLAKGLRQTAIAEQLGIAERTVSTHLHHIYEKLHVHSAAGAVGKLLGDQAAGRH
jgi:DNA-binding NarL/FixJ family response regulator